jgi:hypothetical protein
VYLVTNVLPDTECTGLTHGMTHGHVSGNKGMKLGNSENERISGINERQTAFERSLRT